LQAYAERSGDLQSAQSLQRQIDELEARAHELDRKRSQTLSAVSDINQRNREHMKRTFLSSVTSAAEHAEGEGDDPFTRKSGKMRVVSGRTVKVEEVAGAAASVVAPVPFSSIKAISVPPLPLSHDLFSVHNVDIELQLQLPTSALIDTRSALYIIAGTAPGASRPQMAMGTAPKPAGSRALTLEEYKKRKGL